MKINTMAELRAAVMKEKKGISIADVALSKNFKKFVLAGVDALFRAYDMVNPISFNVMYEPENKLTGCTDNEECIINAGNPLFTQNKKGELVSVPVAYNRILGVLFHEMGHILYTDIQHRKREAEIIIKEKRLVEPSNLSLEYRADYEAINKAVSENPSFRNLVAQMLMTFSNIIEDGRIEKKLLSKCSSAVGFCKGLRSLREFQFEDENFSEDIEMMRSKGAYEFQMITNTLLYYSKFDKLPDTYKGNLSMVDDVIPYVDDYMVEGKTSRELYDDIRMIIVIAWRYGLKDIMEEIKEAQENASGDSGSEGQGQGEGEKTQGSDNDSLSGSESNQDLGCGSSVGGAKSSSEESEEGSKDNSGGGSDNKDENSSSEEEGRPLTKEEVEEIINEIIKELEEAKNTSDTEYDGSGEANKKEAKTTPAIEDNSLDKIMEAATEEKIRGELEEELASCIRNIGHQNSSGYKNIVVLSNRDIEGYRSYGRETTAEQLKEELFYPVRKTAREINRHIVSDQRTGKQISFTGPKFKASKAYKGDLKYFEKKGNKVDTKRLAVAVRVDESGSMNNNYRYEYARKAAAMLYMLSESIQTLDVAIYGDTAHRNEFVSVPYCDFGVKPKNTIELLAKMCPKDGNDDAMALKILGEKLLMQDADERILISISDGLPSQCTSYELSDTVQHYIKKGVNVIAMAIGDDKESIAGLYGKERFCNIENLEDLPKILTNLIKRKL